MMNVRELPQRVEKFPVVEALHLGWLGRYSGEGGYHCAVMTHDKDAAEGERFNVHVLRAPGLTAPWKRIESDRLLSNGVAAEKMQGLRALAEWDTA